MNFKLGLTWALVLLALMARAQTSVFTYQGQLGSGGVAVTGNYDFRFQLSDTNGAIVAGPVTNAPVGVTNGLFTTAINFGAPAFNGAPRWLNIAVRSNGLTSAYTDLLPIQPITSTPYAIQALNAAQLSVPLAATNITGTLPAGLFSTNVAFLNSNQVFTGSDTLTGVVTATNPANLFTGSFSGSGAGLTALSTLNLSGTLPDQLLSSNVAMLDATNANFSSNVTAVQFTGSGHGLTNVPGAFFWLTVNGTNAQAGSNLGFITTNSVAPVIITLPSAPSAGDTFRVAGAGAGGWIIAQNAGQSILAGNLADTTGLNWTQRTNSGVNNWTGLASSADGTRLVAVSYGYVYVSTNSGTTWTQSSSSSLYWSGVAASTSGSNLVATVGSSSQAGSIYTSVNGGYTWSLNAGTSNPKWLACASSDNGSNLVAVSYDGYIYRSVNAGSSWSGVVSNSISWTGVASSADGTRLAICSQASGGGYLYTSTNSGGSWQVQTNSGLHSWSAIASSSDGTHLVATATATTGTGGIYVSANGGVTWAAVEQNSVNWTAVTSSADGSHLAAVYGTLPSTLGYVYTSDDSGSTWLQRLGAPNAVWTAVASSADGSKIAAAVYNGFIYTSGQGSTTTGTTGYLVGGYQSALEIQYIGGGVFLPLSHEGTIRAY